MFAFRFVFCVLCGLLLAGCQDQEQPEFFADLVPVDGRWYHSGQLEEGAALFAQHCASCHGQAAQGLAADWKQKLPDGSFPPPPLNGSAHTWHHNLSVLDQVIAEGGVLLGGKMPGFGSELSADQRRAVIAYFQEFWNDDIYANWLQMGGTN